MTAQLHTLNPEPATMRTVGGHFATGITVVTASHDGEPVGMACNSFATVSLVGGILLVLGGCVLTYFVVVTGDAASHALWGGYIQR